MPWLNRPNSARCASASGWSRDGAGIRPRSAPTPRLKRWRTQSDAFPFAKHKKKKKKNKKFDTGEALCFQIPSSWKHKTTELQEKKQQQQQQQRMEAMLGPLVEQPSAATDENLCIAEKLRILKEQENFVPTFRVSFHPQTHDGKTSKQGREASDWISRYLELKPLIGCSEGSRSLSSVGRRLVLKSRQLNLWHEEVSQSDGKPAKRIFLGSVIPTLTTVFLREHSDQTKWHRPICHLMRENAPFELRTSAWIAPEEQTKNLEKGGHIPARNMLHDYKFRLQALRRQKKPSLVQEEARLLLCKGILNENAQEYAKALESYCGYLRLCKKTGDKQGEIMAYNLIGCCIQEEEDLKLAKEQEKSADGEFQIPTTTVIQYEKAEEYHKMHADTASLVGKYMAYTNLGLLYATVGRFEEAAISHQKALRCATLLGKPEDQGIAVGNLGFLLFCLSQWETSKLCMTKYLQICMFFKDIRGLARAHYILGNIALQYKRHEDAVKQFRTTLRTSRSVKDHKMEALAKIMIGIAEGSAMYDKLT